ncbi:PH domain-containing protein [Acinetobacter seifertii]|uniref:PH domain-containing protein n=1 Tax=Acinetobacter seifertii TaxID=1530123 RepID=UPI0032B3E8EB
MKFRSKIDWWILILFVVITAHMLIKIYELTHNYSLTLNFQHLIIYSLVIFLIWMLVFSTYYVVENNTLIIKSLIFRWKINISDITQIEPTHNPLSSPTLSLDRLKISYMKNGRMTSIMISPKDKEDFISALRNNSNAKF